MQKLVYNESKPLKIYYTTPMQTKVVDKEKEQEEKIEMLKKKIEDLEYELCESWDENLNTEATSKKRKHDEIDDNLNSIENDNESIDKKNNEYNSEVIENEDMIWTPPEHCIPICADVMNYSWDKLAKTQLETAGRLFDCIMMDPPWQLASANPSRGVAIGYSQLQDTMIESMRIDKLSTSGYIFIWAINAKYRFAYDLMSKWGYKPIDEIAWVKSSDRRISKSHGFYLQHCKEVCLIGKKVDPKDPNGIPDIGKGMLPDMIFSERRGQSQKPTEIYQFIEKLVPNGYYLEIFGRRNNLRDFWVTIGNEL